VLAYRGVFQVCTLAFPLLIYPEYFSGTQKIDCKFTIINQEIIYPNFMHLKAFELTGTQYNKILNEKQLCYDKF